MSMVASVSKLLEKSPSPARVSFTLTPCAPQSAITTKPPLAVRVACSLAQVICMPSSGSIGLPSRHLRPPGCGLPSCTEARSQVPALGAGSSAKVIGPGGPEGAGAAATVGATTDDAAAVLVALLGALAAPPAELSAGFEHP